MRPRLVALFPMLLATAGVGASPPPKAVPAPRPVQGPPARRHRDRSGHRSGVELEDAVGQAEPVDAQHDRAGGGRPAHPGGERGSRQPLADRGPEGRPRAAHARRASSLVDHEGPARPHRGGRPGLLEGPRTPAPGRAAPGCRRGDDPPLAALGQLDSASGAVRQARAGPPGLLAGQPAHARRDRQHGRRAATRKWWWPARR